MKMDRYKIIFRVGDAMALDAMSAQQAKILAQADRIKRGMDYEVESIVLIEEKANR